MMPPLGDLTGVVGETRALEYAFDLKTNNIQRVYAVLASVGRYVSKTLMRYCYKLVNGIAFDGR